MTRKDVSAIDSTVEDYDTFVGLAKAAASSPSPRADIDIQFYLAKAEKKSGTDVDPKTRHDIELIFAKTMPERIKHVEEVIKKYEKKGTDEARSQIEWYANELSRLKNLQRKH